MTLPADPVLSLGFAAHGRPGSVQVRYGVTAEPTRLGFHVVGLPPESRNPGGFPWVEATVDCEAEGYAAWMQWVEVVDVRNVPGPDC